jgi:F-type H+-transporting ATPase subunit gamma
LFKAREVKVTALVLITADRGFAGAYNTAVLRVAEQRLKAAAPGSVQCVVVGRKGRDYLRRRGYPVLATHTDLPGEASLELARQITNDLTERYIRGEVDRVEILYTHFVNAIVRKVLTETFLPIGNDVTDRAASAGATIFEPNAESIFAELLPRYATAKLYASLADSLASEHSARMVAMGSARKNAGELVDALTLTRNRLRQAAITREISELVGGAEALN